MGKRFKILIIGDKDKSSQWLQKTLNPYKGSEMYYFPESQNLMDLINFRPNMIIEQRMNKVIDCDNLF